MKTFKNLFGVLLILVCLFLLSCTNESDNISEDILSKNIGELQNKKPVITYNQDKLFKIYDRLAFEDGIDTKFTHFEIKELDTKGDEKYYGLFVYNKSETVRSITVLKLNNNALDVYKLNGGSITCTTTSCSSNFGCTAIQETNEFGITYWTCSYCAGGNCKKTTTVSFK